jgi:hypothetical protein
MLIIFLIMTDTRIPSTSQEHTLVPVNLNDAKKTIYKIYIQNDSSSYILKFLKVSQSRSGPFGGHLPRVTQKKLSGYRYTHKYHAHFLSIPAVVVVVLESNPI